jgi:hypothetical protein
MQRFKSIQKFFSGNLYILSAVAFLSVQPAVSANATTSELVEALEQNNVFAAGISVSIRKAGPELLVSTYRNSQATNEDCKIEALLAAKTIFDTGAEGVSRVKVFFFEPTLDKYKEVSMTKGDVLSFQSGQLKQQELLSSMVVQELTVVDASDNVANYLEASRRRPVRRELLTRIKGQNIDILTNMDAWVDDSECKFEAIKLAERALKIARGYKRVKIVFVDPLGRKEDRMVEFEADQLKALSQNVNELVASVPLSQGQGQWLPSQRFKLEQLEASIMYATPGLKQKERGELLERLKKLSKNGVGVKPFLESFLLIEDAAVKGNQEEVDSLLSKLSTSLDEQEARAVSAKEFKPIKTATSVKTATATTTTSSSSSAKPVEGSMDNPYIRNQILANPPGAFEYYVKRWRGKDKNPADFPNYFSLMKVFVKTLTEAKRPAEAKIYQEKLNEVKKVHPDW